MPSTTTRRVTCDAPDAAHPGFPCDHVDGTLAELGDARDALAHRIADAVAYGPEPSADLVDEYRQACRDYDARLGLPAYRP